MGLFSTSPPNCQCLLGKQAFLGGDLQSAALVCPESFYFLVLKLSQLNLFYLDAFSVALFSLLRRLSHGEERQGKGKDVAPIK